MLTLKRETSTRVNPTGREQKFFTITLGYQSVEEETKELALTFERGEAKQGAQNKCTSVSEELSKFEYKYKYIFWQEGEFVLGLTPTVIKKMT